MKADGDLIIICSKPYSIHLRGAIIYCSGRETLQTEAAWFGSGQGLTQEFNEKNQ